MEWMVMIDEGRAAWMVHSSKVSEREKENEEWEGEGLQWNEKKGQWVVSYKGVKIAF